MSSLSDISIFAVVLAVNLFLFGALLAGGLAVVLRFTENAPPRFRYLISIAVFLMAIFLPLHATALKNSARPKAVIIFTEPDSNQKNEPEISELPNYPPSDKVSDLDLPSTSRKFDKNFINDFVLSVTNSFAGSIFISIWILGSLLLFSRELVGIRRLKQSKKHWTRASELDLESWDCPKNILLYFADDQTPGTIGWLRPAVVLPKGFPVEISFQAKRFIVRHELAHARWRDPLASFLLRAIRNVFWISPALWLIGRLALSECEAAADRAAIVAAAENQNSQATALNYAETLLSIAKSFRSIERRNRQPQIVGIGAEGELEIRIRRLLSSYKVTRRQIASAVCACFLTAVIMAVIPVASFSEIAQKTKSQNFFFADHQNNLPSVRNINDPAIETSSDFSPQKIAREQDKSIQSNTSLKKLTNENSPLTGKNAGPERRAGQPDLLYLNSDDPEDDKAISAKILGDEDARQTGLREIQPATSRSNNLENLSAIDNSGESSSRLRNIEPARKSLTTSENNDKSARQQALSDLNSRRDYSPKLPAPAKPPKPYTMQYIPYPPGQNGL